MGISSAQSGAIGLIPPGAVMPFAGATSPAGWLLCYGQAISRTEYALLFSVISTTYGSGDGSTTFNVPDMRGRVPAGQDDMGGTSANRLTNPASTLNGIDGDVLGGAGGSETHTLTTAQLASHTHDLPSFIGVPAGTAAVFAKGYYTGTDAINPSAATGGGNAHNNVQPTIILNYIIKV